MQAGAVFIQIASHLVQVAFLSRASFLLLENDYLTPSICINFKTVDIQELACRITIIEWFGLQGTFKDHVGHNPLPWAG